jgi:hypothetical protein
MAQAEEERTPWRQFLGKIEGPQATFPLNWKTPPTILVILRAKSRAQSPNEPRKVILKP